MTRLKITKLRELCKCKEPKLENRITKLEDKITRLKDKIAKL